MKLNVYVQKAWVSGPLFDDFRKTFENTQLPFPSFQAN